MYKFISINFLIFISFLYLLCILFNIQINSVNIDYYYSLAIFILGILWNIEFFIKNRSTKAFESNKIKNIIFVFIILFVFIPLLFFYSKSVVNIQNLLGAVFKTFFIFLIPYLYKYKHLISLNLLSLFGYFTLFCELICLIFLYTKLHTISDFNQIGLPLIFIIFSAYLCKIISLILIIISLVENKFNKNANLFHFKFYNIVYMLGIILFIIALLIFGY